MKWKLVCSISELTVTLLCLQWDLFGADIGGVVGLWLGMSVLSAVEVIDFLAQICRFYCRPRQRQSRDPHSRLHSRKPIASSWTDNISSGGGQAFRYPAYKKAFWVGMSMGTCWCHLPYDIIMIMVLVTSQCMTTHYLIIPQHKWRLYGKHLSSEGTERA